MATLRSMFEGKIDLTDPENWDAVRVQQWNQVAGDLNQPLVGDPDAGFPIDITVPPPAMYLDDLDAAPGGTHNFSRKPLPGYTPGQTQNFPRKPPYLVIDTSDWNIPAAPIGMTGSLATMGITGLMATEDVQQFVPPPSDTLYIPTFGTIEPPPQIDYMAGVQVEFAQPWQPPEPVGPVRQSVLDEAHYYASIKPQGPTVNVTMPQVGGTLLAAPQPQAPSSPDDFFRDIEILPGGMALPGSPLDNFLDWVREGFREAPGNYYGDAQLAAMQQERLAGMGLAGASPGPQTNPFGEYSRAYDENPDARWQERFSAGGEAFFGSVGAWIGHGAGQAGNAIMSSPVGEPITWAMWNWGKVDDLAIAPTPALLGYSPVETVWGPWEARERWLATPEAQGLLEAQGSATPQMIRERYNAVLEQSGRVIADEWLVGYQEEQARLNVRGDALVPLLQDGGLGALGDYFSRQGQMLQGYVEHLPQAYAAMKTARNPYTYGIFPSDPRYGDFKQVPYGAYGGWNADISRNMPIEATYTHFANWIVTKPQRIEQALEFAELADTYASSETDVGYEPEELRLAAAQARAEAAELEAMGPENWIDQNISLTTRIGYNLLFDWTNLVSWGMDAFGLSGSAMRAARAAQGVVGVDDAAAAANVAAGVARGNVVDLADDGYQVLQGGFLPYAFDTRRRVYYPDVELRDMEAAAVGVTTDAKSKAAFVEAKNISLDAALGVAAPSMEDDVLDAIDAAYAGGLTDGMLTADELADLEAAYGDVATVAAELAGYTDPIEWLYTPRRVTNMPTEVRNLQLPRIFFEDPSVHRLMDTEATDRLRGYLGRNWMEFQTSSGAPVFEASDIYGRIAQREDTWGIAGGIMQQADAAIAAGGSGVVQLPAELLADRGQLWDVVSQVQGLAAHGEWSLRGTPADILTTGRLEIVPGQLAGRDLAQMDAAMGRISVLGNIEDRIAELGGIERLTAAQRQELDQLRYMSSIVSGEQQGSLVGFMRTLPESELRAISPDSRWRTPDSIARSFAREGNLGVYGSPQFNQFQGLASDYGLQLTLAEGRGEFALALTDAALKGAGQSLFAADDLIKDAVRSEWDVYRAGLAGRAEKFQAASWLYEQFAAGSLPEQQSFMATVDDLAVARTADEMMEASDLGYHIDWESMTVGKGGARVQIVPGAAAEPSVMRSAEPWLETRITQAVGTSHPTMTDIALRGYGQDVLDTLERGGTGVYLAGGEDARTAYRQISDVAAEADLGVQVLDVDEGGFIYRLAPLGEGGEQYPQLAAFDERFPGKTSSAFRGGAEYLEDLYIRNREAWRANRPRNFWDVIPFVNDAQEVAEEAVPGIVRSRAETEARLAAIRAEEELGRDLGPVIGQVVDPVTVLAGPTSGEMVYMVPRPGTWYINNKGDLVLKPQSKWVNDPTTKSGRKWEAGFTFYTDPAGAVQGTPYEDLFGTPQQAYLNANPRVGREYRWGGQTVEPPASLGWADDAEIERGIMGVDEEVLDFSNRVYDNPVDVGGIEDLYWFQSPDDTSLPMSRPRSPYNPLIPKSDLAFYTEAGNEGLFYAENLAQYQMSADRGLTQSTTALSKAQREQRDALREIQAMRQQIDDLYRPVYGQVGEVGEAGDYGDYLFVPEEARLAAMELAPELALLEAQYSYKYGAVPPKNDALVLKQFQPKTQYSGGEYGAIEAALADYPIIAVPRNVFEEQTALAKTQYGDPLFSSQAAGESSTTLRTTTRSDPFTIPSGSYTVGATQPAALPRQTSSTGTGYEAFVGDLYRRGAALAQTLTDDTRYQLYRDHILGSLGFANRKGEGFWAEGPVQLPAGPVRPGGSVFDVLRPEEYLPKGVPAIAGSVPAGDMPDVARAGIVGAALKADNWKDYAIMTGAWHDPAQATWKGQVPWWMRHYGNQYYPSNEAGLREMLGTLLSRAPEDVPQELVDNPGLLKDYQRLVGYTLGHDVFEWEQVPSGYTLELMLSPKELDPTYWPAMAAVKGNEWASDIPLNVRERIQADWVREMESFQVLPRGQDWYRDYRDAFMGGSRVEGPAPYPGSPAAADAGFMTRELDANLVADWDIDAMKKAAAAVKKLGFTPEAQAAHELWQDIWPGLVEHIDFRPAQINRDFWAAVDKTAQTYKDVPKWMDDLFLRVQEARAGFERFLYGDEPLWAFRGPAQPRAKLPVRQAGDPFDWLMARIDRLPPEQAEAARALMATPASNVDDMVSLSGRSIIDEMRAFMPSDLIDEFNAEFTPLPSAPTAPAAAALTVQGPLSIPVGDELLPLVPGSGDVDGNFYLAQAKGYTGAPRATMVPPVGDELTPEQAAATFGVFEGDNGRRLRGPQSLPAGSPGVAVRMSPAQQAALNEIEQLRQEVAAVFASAAGEGLPDRQFQRARNLAQQLNALETEYAVKYGGEQADLFGSSGGKTRPAPLRSVQEVADDWDPATDPNWGWMRDKEGNYVAGGQQSRPAGPMPEPPDWLDDDGLVTMHGGFGFFGVQPPRGRVSDYGLASRKYSPVPDIAEYGFVSYVDALRAGRLDILEEQLRLRAAEGTMVGGPVGSRLYSEYNYAQTFLQRIGPDSGEMATWTSGVVQSTSPYKLRPSIGGAAINAPSASLEPAADMPFKIGTEYGKGGLTFKTEADQLAFATWMDTTANQVPTSFYAPPLGSVIDEMGQIAVLEEQRQGLYALGYTDEDLASMKATDAEWILDKGKRKSGTYARRTDGYTAWVTEERQGQMSTPAAADNLEEGPVIYSPAPEPTASVVEEPVTYDASPAAAATDESLVIQDLTGYRVTIYNPETGKVESGVVLHDKLPGDNALLNMDPAQMSNEQYDRFMQMTAVDELADLDYYRFQIRLDSGETRWMDESGLQSVDDAPAAPNAPASPASPAAAGGGAGQPPREPPPGADDGEWADFSDGSTPEQPEWMNDAPATPGTIPEADVETVPFEYEPLPGDDTVPFDYEPLPGEQDTADWPMTGVQDYTGGWPPMSLPFTRSARTRSYYYDPNAPIWQQVEQMGGGQIEWGEPYWMQDMPAYSRAPSMGEPGPLTFKEFERVARQDPGPTIRNSHINPADWGFSPDPYEEMTIVSGLGIEEARQVKELYPGSIIRFQRRTAKGQYGYRVAENGEILPVFNRAAGQADDGDIYEVIMPQVATEMPPAWPELKFGDDGELLYGQRSEGRLWPEKEVDSTFDLEAWLAEKAERERQIREWYTTTYVPGQQAAGSTEIRSVDYFLGLYGGMDARGSWGKVGDELTFRHPPEAMPAGAGFGFSAAGPQGVTEAQDLLNLLAAEGIDAAANEAALVEAINNLVGGAAGAAQNIGSSQGGWQGFINRVFGFVGGGGSVGGGGVPPGGGAAAAAAAMPPGGSSQPFLTNLTQPWQPPLLYGPPKGPTLQPGGEYVEVAGAGSRVEWSQDLSQLRRYGELDDPWRDYIPWGDSRSTRAVRAAEEFDLFGTVLAGTGAGSAEMAVLINRLALDPTSLITGIDSAMLPKLMSQADADGIWRLGAGTLGNMDMAQALPLLDYAGNDLMEFSARLAANYYGENIDFNQFKDIWGQIFGSASQRFFGTGSGDNIAWRGVNAVGDVQRSVLAEANLSLNPQVWAGNAISANYINAVEGYGTFTPLDELEAGLAEQVGGHVARSRGTVNAPTVRTQGALEGKAVGSGAFLGLNSSSMLFRPRRWVDSFIDVTMGWWASEDLLGRVDEGLDAFAARFQKPPRAVRQSPYYVDPVAIAGGYDAYRTQMVGAGIAGPAPVYNLMADPLEAVLRGGYDNYRDVQLGPGIEGPVPLPAASAVDTYSSYRDLFLGVAEGPAPFSGTPAAAMAGPGVSPAAAAAGAPLPAIGGVNAAGRVVVPGITYGGVGQPGQAMGSRALLEKYNPFAPFASISEGASNLWTGMTTTMAGRVPIGEQANYFRTFAQANSMARRDLLPEAFGPVVARGETLFGADDPVIQALTGEYVRNQMLTSNRYEIGESLDAILEGMVDKADPNYRQYRNFIANDLLGTFDEYNLSALKAAKAGADNVMLEPSHKTNFDEWVSPFLAFAYFGMHNAYNWIGRSLRDPGPLRNFLLFERAAAIQNENQDVPTRYEGMIEGPFGWYYNNPTTALTGGLNRLAPNPIGQEQLAEAETPQEVLLGMAGAANQRFLPFYDAALRGDMSVPKMLGQFGWQFVAADQAMRSVGMHGIGVTTDEFTNYRAGRYLGAETLAGNYTPATGLMGQQVLYEEQWDVPEEYSSDQVAAVGEVVAGAAKQAVAAEELARTLVRTFLLPFSARPPINEGELIGAQLSNQMQAVGPSVPGGSFQNMDVIKGENLGWYAWAARGLLYPESDERPQDQPIDNLEKVIPGGIPPTPSVPPPAGWEPPVWDTSWGRYMDGPDDSPYAEEGDSTALYVMVDPITGLIRYVGQSIHPSERFVQHMEQFKEDGFDHPKTRWEASLYAQGTYPRMYVFDWQPGTVSDRNDEADKAEQRWIGFLRYEVGIGFEGTETGDVNKDVPDESVWRALMEEAGQTPEMYWQIFRSWPETLDPVRLDKEPNIDWNQYSPFPGQPLSPEGILLLEANPPEQKRTGEDFSTWIKGVTLETDAAIHAAGVTTWQELADVATDPVKVGEISKATGKSVDQVLKWAGLAATTVAIQRGQMPMQIPEPEVKKEDVPAVGAPGSVSPSATYDPLSSARLTATASTTTGAPNSATVASSGMLGTSLTPAWMPSAAQGTEPYRVYSEEQLTEGIARLSLLNQLAIDEGYGTSAMSRPQLQRSYEFVQDVTRTYPFKSSARDYLLDNVYTYVYDLESKTGGGYYDIENNVISLQTAQEEGAIHEMSHAYWNTLREEELGEGVTYAGALAASLQMTGEMMKVDPDAYDPELAALVDEYLVGNKEGTFTGFYGYGEGRDAWINDHEIYAGLASWAMGDIDLLPESLRPYYAGLFEPSPAVNYREAYLASGDAYDNRSLIGQAVRVAAGSGATAEDFMPKADTGAPVSVPPQSGLGMPSMVDVGAPAVSAPAAMGVPGWDVVAPLHTAGVSLDPGLAQQPYRPTTGPQASAPAGGLTGMAQTWLRAGQRALGNLFRLGQAANAQVGAFTTTVNQYLTMMERTGGEGASGPVQAGPQVSTKYYYLPGWGATVRPGEEFWLPELPDGAQFWMPANMIRFRDSEGYPDPDYVNNPMFDRTQPDSFKRMQEVYGPLQPVPLEYLMAEPAYMGPASHSSFDQPRLVAGGRKGLQGNPYGVQGAGGMYTTIGAPDPRENPVEYANWQAMIAEPRGDYGIWLDTPYSGNRTLTQSYGDNPESYARFGTAGHTGLDWSMKEGSEIYAAAPGMVTTVGYDEDGYGNYVIIGHDFGQTLYGHLGGVGVEQGQYLATGDLLGLSGNTGNSTGGHLHFELILPGGPDEMQGRVDPTPYLPGSGQPSAGGWLLTDVPGVSAALAAALVDAGVTTPEQLAGLAPLPGQSAPPNSAELAHWLDVNVINQAGRDAISAQQGWNLVAGARALLQMGPKPVKEKKGEGAGTATPGAYGVAQEGGTPLRPGVVPGLGEKTIETLNKAGITTFEQLSGRQSGMTEDQWIEELIKLDDIGPTTAVKLVTGTKSALSSGALTPSKGIPAAKEGDTPLRPGVVAGLGEKTIETLKAAGITTFEQLSGDGSGMSADKWIEELTKLDDIGPTTAEKLVTGTKVALASGTLEPMGGGPPPAKEGDRPLTPGLVDKVGASAIANLAALPTPITTVEQLAATSPDWLDANVKDFGPSTAIAAYTSANEIAQTPWDGSPDLEALPHVGEKKAAEMREAGYGTRDALETVSPQRFGFDMGMNVEKARELLNAFRAQVGLPELTPEIEAELQKKEGVTPEDFEWLSNIGPTNEEKLYAQGTVTEQALYDLGISGIKSALGITEQKALEIYNELRVKRGEEPIATVQEARDVSDPKIPVGQEAGMLGITGATNDQQILLQAHNIQTLQELIDEDSADIARWLGIKDPNEVVTMQERARKDIAARGGGTYFDPDALKTPGASPYAATRSFGPVRDTAAVAAGWRRLLREEKVDGEVELEPKPDRRLELGDTVEKLQARTEDPGQKAVEVAAARKPETFSRENKSGSGGAGVNMDELENKLLERLRGRLTREVFSEFEKVLAV